MTRGDWVGAFVTLVATGIGYFVSGPRTAAVCILVGTLGASVLHFTRKKDTARAEGGGAVDIRNSLNPAQKQEFSPVFSPNIVIGTNPPSHANRPAPPEAPKRKPNVHYKSLRIAPVGFEDHPTCDFVIRELDHDTGTTAIIACVRNDPIVGVRTAEGVTAHLTPKDAGGRPVGTGVSKACWLNTPGDSIDLVSGEFQHVVLLAKRGKDLGIPWKRWVEPGPMEADVVNIDERVAILELEIVDSWGEPLLPLLAFDVSVREEQLLCALRQLS